MLFLCVRRYAPGTTDFQFGLLGHLDGTICIFGARLMAAVGADTLRMLHTVLRVDGRAIKH
jgi:hypothetical protein